MIGAIIMRVRKSEILLVPPGTGGMISDDFTTTPQCAAWLTDLTELDEGPDC
jgi:hypothetical protein